MKQDLIEEKMELPDEVKVSFDNNILKCEGKKGKIEKKLFNPKITVMLEGNTVKLSAKNATRREKTIIGTFKAHIANMIKGARDGFVYRLKICSGHFPMTVTVKGDEFIVKNYVGEKTARILKIKSGVDVKIEGDIVVVSSIDKELAGQTAASIEKLTSRSAYDKRVFQDGIYITEKAGKEIR